MKAILKDKRQIRFHALFIALFLLYSAAFYPGLMSGDSYGMLEEAKKHNYTTAGHPPLIGFIFQLTLYVFNDQAGMFFIHMILLWGTVYILCKKIFLTGLPHYFPLCIPFIPHILIVAGFVWKDIFFAFGYAFLSVILAYKTIHSKKFTRPGLSLFIIALACFTGVKYQAKFVLPIILYWLFSLHSKKRFNVLIYTLVSCFSILSTITIANNYLLSKDGGDKNHHWQYVKLYDLAGMSLHANEILVPSFLFTHNTTLDVIEKIYLESNTWDPLVKRSDSPFRKTNSNAERSELLKTWQKSLLKHPDCYLKHRWYVWKKGVLFAAPGLNWANQNIDNKSLKKYLFPLLFLFDYIFILPIQVFYFLIGIMALENPRTANHGKCIIIMGLSGWALLAALFIFSLASTYRYIIYTITMFMVSTPFAIHCLLSLKKNQKPKGMNAS